MRFGDKAKRTRDHQGRGRKGEDEGCTTIRVGDQEGSPEPPSLPSLPRRLHLPASLAQAAGRGKKKFGPSIPGMRFLVAGAGGAGGATRAGRARGGAAGQGARTRPGRGPSMAEPLLRKTFSRLRGREKLPRKKSDAKERGKQGGRRRRGRRAPPSLRGGPGAPRRVGWEDRGSPSEPPTGWGGVPRMDRGLGRKALGRRGVRTVMCAWPGMPALRAPWEAREGASPLTGSGAETLRLESGGRRSWETGTLGPSQARQGAP